MAFFSDLSGCASRVVGMKEERGSLLKTVAVFLSAIAALGAWLFPRDATTRVEVVNSTSSSQAPAKVKVIEGRDLPPANREGQSAQMVKAANPQRSTIAVEASKARSERPPWEFDLADNEQKVLLSGRASVAVQFNNVSGEEFPTVRLSVGDESTPYPVLGAGKRIQFECGGRSYFVSVLAINETDKVVRLRVDAV